MEVAILSLIAALSLIDYEGTMYVNPNDFTEVAVVDDRWTARVTWNPFEPIGVDAALGEYLLRSETLGLSESERYDESAYVSVFWTPAGQVFAMHRPCYDDAGN